MGLCSTSESLLMAACKNWLLLCIQVAVGLYVINKLLPDVCLFFFSFKLASALCTENDLTVVAECQSFPCRDCN